MKIALIAMGLGIPDIRKKALAILKELEKIEDLAGVFIPEKFGGQQLADMAKEVGLKDVRVFPAPQSESKRNPLQDILSSADVAVCIAPQLHHLPLLVKILNAAEKGVSLRAVVFNDSLGVISDEEDMEQFADEAATEWHILVRPTQSGVTLPELLRQMTEERASFIKSTATARPAAKV